MNAQPQQAISAPLPEVNPIRETAFTGILRFSSATKKFYLETWDAEAITLEVPKNVTDLTKYIGRRIFAAGDLNTKTGILTVTDAQDLELLPTQVTPIPAVPTTSTQTTAPTTTSQTP